MPSLGYLTCNIVKAADATAFPECLTRYYDSAVETYIQVPMQREQFYITVESSAFIFSGLACFVFIDGKLQVNRNKVGFTERYRTKFEVKFTGSESLQNGRAKLKSWWFDDIEFGTFLFRNQELD